MMTNSIQEKYYLAHHGIKGQKWGVRKYQNYDGSLTSEGRLRYSNTKNFSTKEQYVRSKLTNNYDKFKVEDIDISKIEARGNVNEQEAKICADLALKKFRKDLKDEPMITRDVVGAVSNTDGKMFGLNNRLKQPTSLAGKIAADAKEKGISYKEASNQIKDGIRYTSVSENDSFVKNYYSITKELELKGYTEIKCKNYFDSYEKGLSLHKSVQSTFANNKGQTFELQFQTPASQTAKELKIPLYEERRKVGISYKKASQLDAAMKDLAEQVKNPKDVLSIKNK